MTEHFPIYCLCVMFARAEASPTCGFSVCGDNNRDEVALQNMSHLNRSRKAADHIGRRTEVGDRSDVEPPLLQPPDWQALLRQQHAREQLLSTASSGRKQSHMQVRCDGFQQVVGGSDVSRSVSRRRILTRPHGSWLAAQQGACWEPGQSAQTTLVGELTDQRTKVRCLALSACPVRHPTPLELLNLLHSIAPPLEPNLIIVGRC